MPKSIIIKKNFHTKRLNILKQINSNFDKLNICGRMNLYYKELLNFQNKYKLSDFNLRTETAAISALSLLM